MQQHDLRDFAETLDLTAFKALSSGIGIGKTKELAAPAQALPRKAEMPRSELPRPQVVQGGSSGEARKGKALKPSKGAKASRAAQAPAAGHAGMRLSLERRLFAWGLDFFFVALSLAVLLAIFTVLAAVRSGASGDPFALAPVQWLFGLKPLEVLAAVYGLFFAYVLLFKVVAGRTLGESLLVRRSRRVARGTLAERPAP